MLNIGEDHFFVEKLKMSKFANFLFSKYTPPYTYKFPFFITDVWPYLLYILSVSSGLIISQDISSLLNFQIIGFLSELFPPNKIISLGPCVIVNSLKLPGKFLFGY